MMICCMMIYSMMIYCDVILMMYWWRVIVTMIVMIQSMMIMMIMMMIIIWVWAVVNVFTVIRCMTCRKYVCLHIDYDAHRRRLKEKSDKRAALEVKKMIDMWWCWRWGERVGEELYCQWSVYHFSVLLLLLSYASISSVYLSMYSQQERVVPQLPLSSIMRSPSPRQRCRQITRSMSSSTRRWWRVKCSLV